MANKSKPQGWAFLKKHEDLIKQLQEIQGEGLHCLRMMGTFVKAAAVTSEPKAGEGTGGESPSVDLVEQMVNLLSGSWSEHPIVFLMGSDNTATPINEIPYRFYTYIFVTKVVKGVLENKRKAPGKASEGRNDQLVIRFTFVPEDILFAQFFFDDRHLFLAASFSWVAKKVPDDFAYAALALHNYPSGGPKPLYAETSRRLLQIYDARYRAKAKNFGEETWILRQTADNDYAVLVSTPFWQRTKSVLQPFDFTYSGPTQTIEIGKNGVDLLLRYLEQMWGQEGLLA